MHLHNTEKPTNGDVCADQLLSGPRSAVVAKRKDSTGAAGDSTVCYGAIGTRLSVSGRGVYDNPVMSKPELKVTIPVVVTTDQKGVLATEVTSPELDSEDDSEPCNWGPLKPAWCQMFRSPKVVLFCLCWTGAIQVSTLFCV